MLNKKEELFKILPKKQISFNKKYENSEI